jgi:hypothetical protein
MLEKLIVAELVKKPPFFNPKVHETLSHERITIVKLHALFGGGGFG